MNIFAVVFLLAAVAAVGYSLPGKEKTSLKTPEYSLVPGTNKTLELLDISPGPGPKKSRKFRVEQDVVFQLFTSKEENRAVKLNDVNSLKQSSFDAKNPTRFVIHGWSSSGSADVCVNIRKAYLKKGNFNVFIVNWEKGANAGYITSKNRVGSVGETVARFITFLNKQTGMTLSSVTIVGHSLGAHVAGFAGKKLGGSGRIGAIVGLDPALPLFPSEDPKERLDASDAIYVEVIHTNSGGLGQYQPIGHTDFYPNYGMKQPGCSTSSCAHSRAHEFFAESITANFCAKQCNHFSNILEKKCIETGVSANMGGEPVAKTVRGVFWLTTNSKSPFAQDCRK